MQARVIIDLGLRGTVNGITGANKADTHVGPVDLARDVPKAEYADLTSVKPGDVCPKCGGALDIKRGVEVGHVFKLGTKYSTALEAKFLDLVALGAAVALADVAQHAHLHRHDVELFADVLADLDHGRAAGAGALGLGDVVDDVDARQLDGQGLALAACLLLAGVGERLARRLGGRRRQARGVACVGCRLGQRFGLVEEPALARVRFAAGPEHAPTRQAQLLVELEDACLEGFLQFGLPRIERLLRVNWEFGLAGIDDFPGGRPT